MFAFCGREPTPALSHKQMCSAKPSQPSPAISAPLINKPMNSCSKTCKNTDSFIICVNKHLVASVATGTSLQFIWTSGTRQKDRNPECWSQRLESLKPESSTFEGFFCLLAANMEWTGATVRASGPIIHTRVQEGTASVKLSTKRTISAVFSGLRRETGLLWVHCVRSSQSSELRSSRGFEKTFCFCVLTSFTDILFSFSRRTSCQSEESEREQRVGWPRLNWAFLAAPGAPKSWRLVSKPASEMHGSHLTSGVFFFSRSWAISKILV